MSKFKRLICFFRLHRFPDWINWHYGKDGKVDIDKYHQQMDSKCQFCGFSYRDVYSR